MGNPPDSAGEIGPSRILWNGLHYPTSTRPLRILLINQANQYQAGRGYFTVHLIVGVLAKGRYDLVEAR
jgi:hypothetical protein